MERMPLLRSFLLIGFLAPVSGSVYASSKESALAGVGESEWDESEVKMAESKWLVRLCDLEVELANTTDPFFYGSKYLSPTTALTTIITEHRLLAAICKLREQIQRFPYKIVYHAFRRIELGVRKLSCELGVTTPSHGN